jgi:hypothetical protein
MEESSLYPPSSGGTKKDQGQATILFPVTTVQQGPDESPSAFLQHLKDTIQKHTTVDPKSQVGRFSSRVNFFLNWHLTSVENFKTTSVYYSQDLTKKSDKDKKHKDLIAALREFPTGVPLPGHATNEDRKDTFIESVKEGGCPGDSPSPLWDHAPYVKATNGGLSVPISKWKARCHLPWIDGSQGLLSRIHSLI